MPLIQSNSNSTLFSQVLPEAQAGQGEGRLGDCGAGGPRARGRGRRAGPDPAGAGERRRGGGEAAAAAGGDARPLALTARRISQGGRTTSLQIRMKTVNKN